MNKLFLICAAAALTSAPALALIWSEPVLLTELNDSVGNIAYRPCLSRDALTIYYGRRSYDHWKLWEASRNSIHEPFANERELSELYVSKKLYYVWVNGDQTRLYYSRHEDQTTKAVIRQASRADISDPWQDVMAFEAIHHSGQYGSHPSLVENELILFYSKTGGIHSATRSSINEEFQNSVLHPELNDGSSLAAGPCIMPDGLTIYFSAVRKDRPSTDIYKATRSSIAEPFGNIERLDFCSDQIDEHHPYVTLDEKTFYYYNEEGIWYAQLIPEPVSLSLLALGAGLIRKRNQ